MLKSRRELIREYKNTPRTAGVGVVRNTANGKVLLVAGADLPALLNRQLAQLRVGAHWSAALQHDWRTLGPEHFTFEVLDTLPPPETPESDRTEDLAALEALWLEKLAPYAPVGYNAIPKPR
jgi:hypothetical protein